MLVDLSMIITSWAIVSLAGGPLGKVEKRERRGEKKEKNCLVSHLQLQQADLGLSVYWLFKRWKKVTELSVLRKGIWDDVIALANGHAKSVNFLFEGTECTEDWWIMPDVSYYCLFGQSPMVTFSLVRLWSAPVHQNSYKIKVHSLRRRQHNLVTSDLNEEWCVMSVIDMETLSTIRW